MALSQPGIFNVLDPEYGMKAGVNASPTINQAALQAAIAACQAAGGGTVLIPAQDLSNNTVYPIVGPINIGEPLAGSAEAVIIAGTAQGQQGAPTLLVEGNGTLFEVQTTAGHIGGINFRDLGIEYDKDPQTLVVYSGTAIDVITGENVRIERVTFFNCAQAVWFEGVLQCSIFNCRIQCDEITPSPASITIGNSATGAAAIEVYIAGTDLFSNMMGGTGIVIEMAQVVRVTNVELQGYVEGINITPGPTGQNTLKHFFSNVEVYTANPSGLTGAAVTIAPQGSQNVSEIIFAECTFEPSNGAASAGPGVYIDSGSGGGIVSDVRFVACRVTRWSGPGIEIVSGTNIEINGGLYSGNASGASPSGGSGGISITGAATNVRIIGAACTGQFWWIINDHKELSSQQDVGIYITGSGASNVIIDHCDLTGNADNAISIGAGGLTVTGVFIRNCNASGYGSHPTNAISIVGEVSNVQITDCPGYNDTAAAVSTSAPTGTFSNTTFGYYGPIAFYVTGTSPLGITIDGTLTGLTSGGFTLGPGETAAITGTVAKFLAVGK